jgi:hypothetical protein
MAGVPPVYMFFVLVIAGMCVTIGKAFQTQNIIHGNYLVVLPTSYLIVFAEVYVIVEASHMGVGLVVIPLGLGGALGCWFSMFLHRKLFKHKIKMGPKT